ncbi:hypothetical protein AX14_009306 [Amanita brunnescens Koide BX004]|nr:hypothetical protein AX14_009306 [Amanita brunnescens Koide BX004]
MTRTRIESLLASFPKLIPTNMQHTSVKTADVRYVYQPLEDLYIFLITNKASNILQDIDTLHLLHVVSAVYRSADEREILTHAFELLGAFDEVVRLVSLGYREQVIVEMENHEKYRRSLPRRNKEAEAKEELKWRAKQLEMQRHEQQKCTASVGGGSYMGGGVTGYSPVSRFEAPQPGTGMKLGAKKTRQGELLDALGGEAVIPRLKISAPPMPIATAEPALQKTVQRGSLPEVTPESVHIVIKEQIYLSLLRDGGVQSMELKGDIKLALGPPSVDFVNAYSANIDKLLGAKSA